MRLLILVSKYNLAFFGSSFHLITTFTFFYKLTNIAIAFSSFTRVFRSLAIFFINSSTLYLAMLLFVLTL